MDVKRSPLAQQVTARLQERIEHAMWPVGSRLPNEAALAAEFGVGRSTIREAIRVLAYTGLVDVRQGSGTFVRATTPQTIPNPELRLRLQHAHIVDVYEVRRALEIEAARLAALRRNPHDIERISAAWAARQSAGAIDFVKADLAFHQAVVDAAHNPVMSELFVAFFNALEEALITLVNDDTLPHNTADAHKALADAVAEGDADAAVRATLANLEITLTALSNQPKS